MQQLRRLVLAARPMGSEMAGIPIPRRGVDYRGKVVLAPMVRSGEMPSRLLALHYGADLVWGPETVDHSMLNTTRSVDPETKVVEWTRPTSKGERSVMFRLHPEREGGRLIFQVGTSNPARAVEAARMVAADVAGIDVNAGCPKPFSTSGGMGAALLRAPDKLCAILDALVRDITPAFGIGISVKIRLLEDPADTEALVRRLVATGITGLTVHCRFPATRPREPARREQLRMVADVCREAGVACLMNGDVKGRDQALELIREFGVDGAMIATAAEKNPSCFRSEADGGLACWEEVAERYLSASIDVENRFANAKYLLMQMIPGKKTPKEFFSCKDYAAACRVLGLTSLADRARLTDEKIGSRRATVAAAPPSSPSSPSLAPVIAEPNIASQLQPVSHNLPKAKRKRSGESVQEEAGGDPSSPRPSRRRTQGPLSQHGPGTARRVQKA